MEDSKYIGDQTEKSEAALTTPSFWLYFAGLIMTLSGLFAVNYALNDPSFATLSYGLTVIGFVFSFTMRRLGVKRKTLVMPVIVLIALGEIIFNSNDQLMSILSPRGYANDRLLSLQLLFVWATIIGSFLLSNDSSVLFAFVPCITMLALVSTHNTDPAIQSTFIVFICASTFLVVQENFIRTRIKRQKQTSPLSAVGFYRGQVPLTIVCTLSALAIANLVVVPLRMVGESLFESTSISPLDGQVIRQIREAANQVKVSEQRSISLATGPVADSDQVVMRIACEQPLYWRGTTFTRYTGTGFDNNDQPEKILDPDSENENRQKTQEAFPGKHHVSEANSTGFLFNVPTGPYELAPSQMKGSTLVNQEVVVVGGSPDELYGAGNVQRVLAEVTEIHVNEAGTLMTLRPLDRDTHYIVTSCVASTDPNRLQSASKSLSAVPESIRTDCLQLNVNNQGNPKLRALANKITEGLKNNYAKAEAIKTYISHVCKYNLNTPAVPRDRDIVEYFLFDSRQGYCDCFGAAMTMLCRYAGIPARLASGFITGEPDADNTYIVRVKHKHIWSEVFFAGIGWVQYDATDGAEDITAKTTRHANARTDFVKWFFSHGPLPPLIGLIVLSMLGFVIKTEILNRMTGRGVRTEQLSARSTHNVRIISAYQEACRQLGRKGFARLNWMTPDEFAKQVSTQTATIDTEIGDLVAQITLSYNEYRYGQRVATEEDAQRIDSQVRRLRLALEKPGGTDLKKDIKTLST